MFKNVEKNIMCFIDNIFYFKILMIIKNKYNITFIPFLLIHYFFKGGEKNIYHKKICK
jgi:hypothetical protein